MAVEGNVVAARSTIIPTGALIRLEPGIGGWAVIRHMRPSVCNRVHRAIKGRFDR
jgi:hypothetical protein